MDILPRFGAGFNAGFIVGSKPLPIPAHVSLIELGYSAYSSKARQQHLHDCDISLHIGRSPITEEKVVRDRYVDHLCRQMEHGPLVSIGFHLCGARKDGIGAYGFSSQYNPTDERLANAADFIESVKRRTGVQVWLENANYYSQDYFTSRMTWKHVRSLCEHTDVGVILDLTHAYVDSANMGVDVHWTLGEVPWDKVVEVHLSGWARDSKGGYHDSHSSPIPEEVLSVFNEIMKLELLHKNTLYTVEHSEFVWTTKPEEYAKDFDVVQSIVNLHDQARPKCVVDPIAAAHNYLYNVVSRSSPLLARFCEEKGVDLRSAFQDWIEPIVASDFRLIMTRDEAPPEEEEEVLVAQESFLSYFKARYANA